MAEIERESAPRCSEALGKCVLPAEGLLGVLQLIECNLAILLGWFKLLLQTQYPATLSLCGVVFLLLHPSLPSFFWKWLSWPQNQHCGCVLSYTMSRSARKLTSPSTTKSGVWNTPTAGLEVPVLETHSLASQWCFLFSVSPECSTSGQGRASLSGI